MTKDNIELSAEFVGSYLHIYHTRVEREVKTHTDYDRDEVYEEVVSEHNIDEGTVDYTILNVEPHEDESNPKPLTPDSPELTQTLQQKSSEWLLREIDLEYGDNPLLSVKVNGTDYYVTFTKE